MKFTHTILLLGLVALVGCGQKAPPKLVFYCSETFWNVMWEETRIFQGLYGVQVEMIPINPKPVEASTEPNEAKEETGDDPARRVPAPWRSRPKARQTTSAVQHQLSPDLLGLISSFKTGRYGDLYLSDDPKQLDELRTRALSSHEYPFCYLTMVLLVPKENPRKIRSVQDMLDKNLRIGIVNPATDGMGDAAWHVIQQTSFGRMQTPPRELIQSFDFQSELFAALQNNEIDAALAWNASAASVVLFADPVTLEAEGMPDQPETSTPDSNPLVRDPVLVSLNTAEEEGIGRRFADFLISNQGRQILRKHHFTPK